MLNLANLLKNKLRYLKKHPRWHFERELLWYELVYRQGLVVYDYAGGKNFARIDMTKKDCK